MFVNKFKRTMRAFTSSDVHKAVLTMLTKCLAVAASAGAMTTKRSGETELALDVEY